MNSRNNFAAILSAVLLLAFMVKAVIPAGFMPESNGGFIKLVICSGMGEKTVLVPADEAPADHKEKQTDKLCAFQTLASGKALVPAPVATLPAPAFITLRQSAAHENLTLSARSLSFDARGPPSV